MELGVFRDNLHRLEIVQDRPMWIIGKVNGG